MVIPPLVVKLFKLGGPLGEQSKKTSILSRHGGGGKTLIR